jgi:hypothetical protein
MDITFDRGPQATAHYVTRDTAVSLARELSPRRVGEGIGVYELRIQRNTNLLISAGMEAGNPLHRYLTRLQPFTSAADRPQALKHAAREALQRKAA